MQGGGVAIYVDKDIKFIDISPDIDDIVAIELKVMVMESTVQL